jgi:hypothetical protein
MFIVLPFFLFGCSTQNKPNQVYGNKERVQDVSEEVTEREKKLSVEEKIIRKETNYNDILNRYKLPRNKDKAKKDNENLSVGKKQTIKIKIQ